MIPEGNLGIEWDSWRQILADEHRLPLRLAKDFRGIYWQWFFEVAAGSPRAVWSEIENQDAVAERDSGSLPGRDLVEPVGTGITIGRAWHDVHRPPLQDFGLRRAIATLSG